MIFSLWYVVLRRLLKLAALHYRSNEFNDFEIVVLWHELAIFSTNAPPNHDVGRSAPLCSGESVRAAGTLRPHDARPPPFAPGVVLVASPIHLHAPIELSKPAQRTAVSRSSRSCERRARLRTFHLGIVRCRRLVRGTLGCRPVTAASRGERPIVLAAPRRRA